jgi:hypothetical protein
MLENEATETRTKPIEIFVNDRKISFDTDDATGAQIKEKSGVPPDYSLYLRAKGSNEPIGDAEEIELKPGEHFFSRPPSNVS